mgnify:CR=1 FL=1
MSCYSEDEIVLVVLDIIKENPGIRTSGLIAEARRIMRPSGEDLDILDKTSRCKLSFLGAANKIIKSTFSLSILL